MLEGTVSFMTRKESEKDSERPHYYSQFWLDVAAGRRIIGAPKENEGEVEELAEPALTRKASRPATDDFNGSADGHSETIVHPVVQPEPVEEFIQPEAKVDLATNEADALDFQDAAIEDADIPDIDSLEDEEEEEDFFDEEEEEEEEEDGWPARGRKKPSPKRPTKQPVKKPKRDSRRGGF